MGMAYSGSAAVPCVAAQTMWTLSQPATALRRLILHELLASSYNATPVDEMQQYHLKRTTAAGTATAFTGLPHDPSQPAASGVFAHTHTVEPTYTANSHLIRFAVHMRSLFRFVASERRAFIIPITNAAGLGLLCNATGSAETSDQVVTWEE